MVNTVPPLMMRSTFSFFAWANERVEIRKQRRMVRRVFIIVVDAMSVQALSQAVLTFYLIFCQAANAWQGASTVGDSDRHHDLIGTRRIVNANFHAVKVAAHEGGIFVSQGDIERSAHASTFLRRRNQGRAFAQEFAYRCAQFRM